MKTLLEKYFNGETSLQEEQELRKWLFSIEIEEEYLPYRSLFETYQEEKDMKITPLTWKRSTRRKRYAWFALVGSVVASLMIIFSIITYQSPEIKGYLIIHGERIDDPEIVAQYIRECEAELEEMLKYCNEDLKIMEEIDAEIKRSDEEIAEFMKEIDKYQQNS